MGSGMPENGSAPAPPLREFPESEFASGDPGEITCRHCGQRKYSVRNKALAILLRCPSCDSPTGMTIPPLPNNGK